ncbi:MAG: GntR family transcriptional regulator [Isosphaeraceae bacterium]
MPVPSEIRPTSGRRLTCDHGLRRQAVVGSLLADIFGGRLRAGQHLVTQELATRFGVSHTPIREALIALAGLGVIDLHPNRGAIVRRVTARDVREVCQVRRVLECEAVRLACGRIDPQELATLSEGLQRQLQAQQSAEEVDQAQFILEARALDSWLHDRIAGACGNAFLANELSRLKTLFRAVRDMAWAHDAARHDYHRLASESREHLAIVEALTAGDGPAASRAMSRHIMAGATYWGRVVRENQANPGGEPSGPAAPRSSKPRGAGSRSRARTNVSTTEETPS